MRRADNKKYKYIDSIIMPQNKSNNRGRKGEAESVNETTLNKAEILRLQDFKNKPVGFWNRFLNAAGEFKLSLGLIFKILFATKVGVVLMVLMIAVPMTAFEAHVVNVTAKIERRPGKECPALSIGYWRNHEGCTNGGGGSSIWETQVQALSATFSGAFASTTGSQMCGNLWIPNCPGGNTYESKLCKARAQTLGNELNVVSERLDLTAVIAGAYDGSSAFTNLGITGNTTVSQAISVAESIIANPSSTFAQLTDAAYIQARIYNFYEDENPEAPMCIYTWAAGGIGAPIVGTGGDAPADDPVQKPGKDKNKDEELTGIQIEGAGILEAVSSLLEVDSGDVSSTPESSESLPAEETQTPEETQPTETSEPPAEEPTTTPEPTEQVQQTETSEPVSEPAAEPEPASEPVPVVEPQPEPAPASQEAPPPPPPAEPPPAE